MESMFSPSELLEERVVSAAVSAAFTLGDELGALLGAYSPSIAGSSSESLSSEPPLPSLESLDFSSEIII
jgi:hypothetical protein